MSQELKSQCSKTISGWTLILMAHLDSTLSTIIWAATYSAIKGPVASKAPDFEFVYKHSGMGWVECNVSVFEDIRDHVQGWRLKGNLLLGCNGPAIITWLSTENGLQPPPDEANWTLIKSWQRQHIVDEHDETSKWGTHKKPPTIMFKAFKSVEGTILILTWLQRMLFEYQLSSPEKSNWNKISNHTLYL